MRYLKIDIIGVNQSISMENESVDGV